MSTTAVIILKAMAREEFERTWHGYEEPFSFIEGDFDEQPPVSHFTTDVAGTTYSLEARDVAQRLVEQLADFRTDVEEEADEDERYFSDEELDEEAWRKLWSYWGEQLDGEDEIITVFETRLHFLVEGFKEMVAHFTMIGDRIPDLKPHLAAKLQEAYSIFETMLDR